MSFENFEVKPTADALNEYFPVDHRPWPAGSLDRLLTSVGSQAMTAVVERDYIDVDYSASYHEQLSRSFTPVKRETTRIHFFGQHLTKRRLMNASDSTIRAMQASYMGFTVVRPDWPTTLGRTLIKCPDSLEGRQARFPTRAETSVDLAGIPLSVESCAYVSQDQKVMACATAALWMSLTPLSEKIPEIAWHSTAEITAMSMSINRPFGPVLGRRGLYDNEMEHALLEIGFDPAFHLNPNREDFIDICHLYVDSGIPPILIVRTNGEGHAVTVVGYIPKPPQELDGDSGGIIPAHRFISDLVIHDDQAGLYLPARVCNFEDESQTHSTALAVEGPRGTQRLSCDAILVPLPTRVMLDEYAVNIQTKIWIQWAREQGWLEDKEIVTRTILIRSNTFKQTLLKLHDKRTHGGYPSFFVNFARGLPMPRYVWLVEISYNGTWDPADLKSPPVVADLILDSTSTETYRPDFLLLHFPQIALGSQMAESGIQTLSSTDAHDHPHLPFPDIPRP